MGSFPAGIGVGAETGMDHGDRRLVIRILQVCEEGTELPYQKHSLVYDRPAGHGNHVGVIVALLENSSGNIKFPVKVQSFFHIIRPFQKRLHDIRHTASCLFAKHLSCYRHLTETEQCQSFFSGNDLKHLFGLVPLHLILREKQLCDTIISFAADLKAFLFCHLTEEFMRYL